jgi:ABC-2 type transport system permease protein
VTFREVFRFEFMYQARRVRTWLYLVVLFTVAYQLMRTAGAGDGVVNSPFAIAQQTVLGIGLWLLMAPAVAGSAAARDAQTRMYPLVYTTPISKADYLGGRFLAAFALNALLLLAVPVATLAALILPGLDPDTIGPHRPAVYLSAYGVMTVPTVLIVTAIQFSVAALTGRAILSYLGTVLFVVAGSGATAVAMNVLQMPALVKLIDPVGLTSVLTLLPRTLSPLEMETLVVGLDVWTLTNRVLWVGIAVAILALTHARFRFDHRAG